MTGSNNWFVTFKPKKDALIRLFCFHYGGGSASIFRQWSKDVIQEVELVAIQLPGREERYNEPLLNNISQVIDNLLLHFNKYTDKPFILFGHSIGALIAFEFARTLRQRKMLQPKHLIVSGTKAPQVPLKKQHIHKLPKKQFIEELKKYNGIPDYIIEDEELISIFIPIIKADFSISETYNYSNKKPLSCPITALGGSNDNTFDADDLIKWQEQTSNAFIHQFLPGDHFFINTSYTEIINIINQSLYNEIKQLVILH